MCQQLFSFNIFSQNNDTINNIIKVYPLRFIGKEYNLAFERRLNDKYTLEFMGSIYRADYILTKFSSDFLIPNLEPARGFALRVQAKKFFKNNAPLGLYGGLLLLYKHTRFDNLFFDCIEAFTFANVDIDNNIVGFQNMFGYQTKILKYAIIDLYSGIGIRIRRRNIFYNYREEEHGIIRIYYDNKIEKNLIVYPAIHLGIDIGFGF